MSASVSPSRRFYPYILPMLLAVLSLLGLWAVSTDRGISRAEVWAWLGREGGALAAWWLLTALAGVAGWPLLRRLLPMFPTQGYALARAAGLLMVGFVFWAGASLGLWKNSAGAMILAWLIVLGMGAALWRQAPSAQRTDWRAWWAKHNTFVLITEILFVLLFFTWAAFRAHEPEVRSTEKPMELMFINSIRQSEAFPPNDAWLAGYAISYYYFGYVLLAMVADLSAVNSGVAFGLAGPWLFALAGIGVWGVVYDLVRLNAGKSGRFGATFAGLVGVLCLLVMGNLGTFFVELPWNGRGLMQNSASLAYFEFWDVPERSDLALRRLGAAGQVEWYIPDLDASLPNVDPARYVTVRDNDADERPDWVNNAQDREFYQWDYWWWFRYSRVVKDNFLNGDPIGVQPIAEVPQFSFILGDIHPHVLALPFALLMVGLALGHALRGADGLAWWGYGLYGVFFGGMVFLNSWDAVYIPLLVGAEALRRLLAHPERRLRGGDWLKVAAFAGIIGALFAALYLPWIISFNSQAGGFYLNIIWPTAPQQMFLQFGGFFILAVPFIGLQAWRARHDLPWRAFGLTLLAVWLVLGVLPFMGAALYQGLCENGSAESGLTFSACRARDITFGGVSPITSPTFWDDLLARRLSAYASQLPLVAVLVFIGFRLFTPPHPDLKPGSTPATQARAGHLTPVTAAVLLLGAAGLVLVLAPDYIYLVDNFRVRINTVFKLYYQGWILFSVVTAYAVYATLSGITDALVTRVAPSAGEDAPPPSPFYPPSGSWRLLYVAIIFVVLGMGLVYPYYGLRSRALVESGRYREAQAALTRPLTLDGRATSVAPDEYAVIQCFLAQKPGPNARIAEAPYNGGYNPDFGRVATLTGVPNLLGWINHEGQWRGAAYDTVTEVVRNVNGSIIDSRELQADKLYRSEEWSDAQAVITRYGLDYIMVGNAERLRYADAPQGLEKFERYLTPLCRSGDVTLYAVGG